MKPRSEIQDGSLGHLRCNNFKQWASVRKILIYATRRTRQELVTQGQASPFVPMTIGLGRQVTGPQYCCFLIVSALMAIIRTTDVDGTNCRAGF